MHSYSCTLRDEMSPDLSFFRYHILLESHEMNLVGTAQAYSYHQKCRDRLLSEEMEKNKVFDFHEVGIDHDVNDTHVCRMEFVVSCNYATGCYMPDSEVSCGPLNRRLILIAKRLHYYHWRRSESTWFTSCTKYLRSPGGVYCQPRTWLSTFAAVSAVSTMGEALGLVSGSTPTCLPYTPSAGLVYQSVVCSCTLIERAI